MDGFKKPYRGTRHVYVRDKEHEDKTLVNLYKDSEFAKENAVQKDTKEPDDTLDIEREEDDIEDFLSDSKVESEVEVPVKKSVKKKQKKAAKKKKAQRKFLKTLAKLILVILLIAAAVVGVLVLFKASSSQNIIGEGRGENAAADELYYAPLTGVEYSTPIDNSSAVSCAMIENSVDARPQSGLRAAEIVYEALAEGGISRFMAVYQVNKPNYIGPLRSARLTFVHFAKQYNCTYIHVGGATNAISEIRGGGYRELDGDINYQYSSRKISPGRRAPHNVYSRFVWIDEFNFNRGWTSSNFTPFARIKPDTVNEVETRDATRINIKLSGDPSYNPHFDYNQASNTYFRSHQRGGAHMDKEENGALTQISPTVVIAMKVHVIPRAGDVNGYKDHVTYGEGEAFVFQDGTVTAATWRRDGPADPLKFYNKISNEEILLNRGQTWITAYPDTIGSVTWQ